MPSSRRTPFRRPPVHHPQPLTPTLTPAPSPSDSLSLESQLQHMKSQLSALQLEISKLSPTELPFRQMFEIAATDPHKAASHFIKRARKAPNSALLDVAALCLNAPVGKVGTRRALRTVAVLLCDEVLRRDPSMPEALCVKGEALLPFIHYGKNDARAPRSVLQEAFALFDAASKMGCTLATFLKGRWLLSMEPLHKDAQQALLGASCVKAAAEANCARALVFLAHRYEYPELDRTVSFAADLPKGKIMREKFILDFYKRAADRGDADALNDIGTSYAEGYGGLNTDFDSAVEYYVRAIEAGSLHAYDNLGTHYETGMGGKFPNRVDFEKALFYYRRGASERCPKCAYNLAAAHEEGMSGTLPRNTKKAEKYYRYSLRLADDANDASTGSKCLKDLVALYLTRIKLNPPNTPTCLTAQRRLNQYVYNQEMIDGMMTKVNKAIGAAARNKPMSLGKLLGDVNSKVVARHVKQLQEKVKSSSATASDVSFLRHVMGTAVAITEVDSPDEAIEIEPPGRKRTRSSVRRSSGSGNKRRRTSRRRG